MGSVLLTLCQTMLSQVNGYFFYSQQKASDYDLALYYLKMYTNNIDYMCN